MRGARHRPPRAPSSGVSNVYNVDAAREFSRAHRSTVDGSGKYDDFIFAAVAKPSKLIEVIVTLDVDGVLQEALALVDIGATNSFVARRFVERYKCATRTIQPLRVHSANGNPVSTNQQTQALVMRLGDRFICPTRFVVMDLAKYDILLGLDFLKRHRAVVDLGTQQMVLVHRGVEHTFAIGPQPPGSSDAVSKSESVPTPDARARDAKPMQQMSRKKFERWVRKHRDVEAFEVYVTRDPVGEGDGSACAHTADASASSSDTNEPLTSPRSPPDAAPSWLTPPEIEGMVRSTARVFQMATGPRGARRAAWRRRRARRPHGHAPAPSASSPPRRASSTERSRPEVNFVRPEPVTEADLEGLEPHIAIGADLTRKFKSMLKSHVRSFHMPDDAWKSCPIQHKIELKPHDRAPSARPYRLSEEDAKQLAERIEEYLAKGWIIPSNSAYSSPVLFAVKKGTTQKRFCVDYRKINALTKREEWPMPHATDLFDRVAGSPFLSSLDIENAFFHIPLTKESQEYTTFVTDQGRFCFTITPFGCLNGSFAMQKLSSTVLRDCSPFCCVFIDDILIWSKTAEEHLQHIDAVLQRLRDNALSVKLKKCKFFCREVEYLGHMISSDGVRTCKSLTDKVLNWPVPKNVKDAQRFLGLAQYYSRFVHHYEAIASPLTSLLRKGQAWQ